MTKRRKRSGLDPDRLGDFQGFIEELGKETARGSVIVGGAFLEAQLGQLIANFLVDNDGEVNNLVNPQACLPPVWGD